MVFVKTIRKEGNRAIHETLDLGGEGKPGSDRIMIYEGCFNEDKGFLITQEDLKFLYEKKRNEKI